MKSLPFAAVALILPLSLAAQPSLSPTPPPLDLNGFWTTGEVNIEIQHLLHTGLVTGTFTPPDGNCAHGGRRPRYIDAKLSGNQIKGNVWLCTRPKRLVDDCGVPSVWGNTFKGEAQPNAIDIVYKGEYYAPDNDDEGDCKLKRDPSRDYLKSVRLTRIKPPGVTPTAGPRPAPCPPEADLRTEGDDGEARKFLIDQLKAAGEGLVQDTRVGDLLDEKAKLDRYWGYWQRIMNATCVSNKLRQAVQGYVAAKGPDGTGDTSADCNSVCHEFGAWYETLAGDSTFRNTLVRDCVAKCR